MITDVVQLVERLAHHLIATADKWGRQYGLEWPGGAAPPLALAAAGGLLAACQADAETFAALETAVKKEAEIPGILLYARAAFALRSASAIEWAAALERYLAAPELPPSLRSEGEQARSLCKELATDMGGDPVWNRELADLVEHCTLAGVDAKRWEVWIITLVLAFWPDVWHDWRRLAASSARRTA